MPGHHMTNFVIYDVFSDAPFGGNQLAVVPDATALPEPDLQRIAREFNFSETTFVFPPDDPAHTARVRIFTPTVEIPFAGHPTIGTAIALRDAGAGDDLVLELGIGPIPCQVSGDSAAFTTTAPLAEIAAPDPALVAQCLSLPDSAIKTSNHAPVQASLGLPFVIAELHDRQHLRDATPDIAAIRKGATAYPAGLDFAIYAYCRSGDAVQARMFAPLDNIPEDPATGSAAATLAALWTKLRGTQQDLTIHQGAEMGRPSLITARTAAGQPAPVTIAGKARQVMTGRFTYR